MPKSPVDRQREELLRCAVSPLYFITTYGAIYDSDARRWIPFRLWAAQIEALDLIRQHQKTVILKARQVGLTWLALWFALWLMLFDPIAVVLLFSRRDDEAVELLKRLKQMYSQLPGFLKARAIVDDNDHLFSLSSGSSARAFPPNAGDSYTATFALIDEADLVPDLDTLLGKVQPTIEAGGRLVLLSRANKDAPESLFKRIYRGARSGLNEWQALFLPWHTHPDRNVAWYQKQCNDALTNEGTLDTVHEQYPATDTEALAGRTLNKRVPPQWIDRVYVEMPPIPLELLPPGAPVIEGARLYRPPMAGRKYVQGLDPAEGNPTSDDSALTIVDAATGEEVALLSGKYQPEVVAAHADQLGRWYNDAPIMVERNNHGHAVLLWLRDHSRLRRLCGHDGKEGWLSNSPGKALLYSDLTEMIRQEDCVLHSFKTKTQIASIEGATLRAPAGELDDCSDSFAFAQEARVYDRERRFGVW